MDMDINQITLATSILANLITEVGKKGPKFISVKKDEFLNYDAAFSLSKYRRSHSVTPFIPYELECLLLNANKEIDISVIGNDFTLEPPNEHWKIVSENAFDAFREKGRASEDGSAIRLQNISESKNTITLHIQKAGYFDQARSNLVLDYSQSGARFKSLRTMLSEFYPDELPPLSAPFLANTVGVATVIFYEIDGTWMPYMVKRAKNVGVFPGGLHCTSSGVAKWPKYQDNFNSFFLDHMYREIFEEVGLLENDVFDMKPIALCREFSRAGKPQIFFAAKTELKPEELRNKRQKAIKWAKDHGLRKEIKDGLFVSEIVKSSDELLDNVKKYSLTLEGIASLYFGKLYLDSFEQ